MSDRESRVEMGKLIQGYARDFDVLCLQEVHGRPSEIHRQLQLWLPNWKLCVSSYTDSQGFHNPGTGGVAICIRPGLARGAVSQTILVPGRCHFASFVSPSGHSVDVGNLHNFDFSVQDVHKVGHHMNTLFDRDCAAPDSFFSILMGDINFDGEGGARFKAGRPISPPTLARPMPSGTRKGVWLPYLERWLEIMQPFPTHFSAIGQTGARLDRGWASSPPHQVLQMSVTSHVLGSPEDFEARGVSDHAPVAFIFCPKAHGRNQPRPIPRQVCRDPAFASRIESLAAGIDLLAQPPRLQLRLYNKIILEAGRRIRERQFVLNPDSASSLRLLVSSISRAIWRNDLKSAKKLLSSCALAREFLVIRNGVCVTCCNYQGFDQLFNEVKARQQQERVRSLQKAVNNSRSVNVKKQLKNRLQAARRFQSIFGLQVSVSSSLELNVVQAKGRISERSGFPTLKVFKNRLPRIGERYIQRSLVIRTRPGSFSVCT